VNADVTDSRINRIELNHISHQSGNDGGRSTGINVSYLNHSGGDETGFRDKPVAVNGNSSKIHVAYWDISSPLESRPIVLCTIRSLISCEPVCRRNICKGSYVSGNLRDDWTLIVGGDDNSSIVGSVGRFAEISTRGSSTYDLCGSRRSFFLQ